MRIKPPGCTHPHANPTALRPSQPGASSSLGALSEALVERGHRSSSIGPGVDFGERDLSRNILAAPTGPPPSEPLPCLCSCWRQQDPSSHPRR